MLDETLKQGARRLSSSAINRGLKPQAIHQYTDSDGAPLYWKIRLKHPQTSEKWIRPIRLNNDGYELGEPEFSGGKPLYKLVKLAAHPGEAVIICEGETCCDALERIGLLATTSGSADSAGRADWSPLAGRSVTIWPDNDDAGKRAAADIEKRCTGIGCKVSIIDVDQLSLDRKGDTVDWLETHPDATADDVRGLPTVERETLYTSSAEEWSDPVRLPEGLPPVQSLNPELLPEVLQPWVEDICDRLQCPLDFVAIPAIVALGSVIGRQVGIRPQARTDWTEIPNLWAMTVGRPGTLKSPAIESALAPLRKLSAHAFEEYESTQKEFDLDMQAAQIREEVAKKKARKAAEQDDSADLRTLLDTCDLEPPVLRRYIANDTTPASLGELLRQNPNGLLVLRDELCSLLASLDREDMSDARGMFLSGWNGNSAYTCDRIGRGLNLHIKAMSISLLGSTQPGRISEYIKRAVKGGIGDDGLIQRFSLMVWPNDKSDWIDRDVPPDGAAARRVFETFDRLSRIDAESIDATRDDPDGLPFLRLGDAALEMFVEWRAELETHIRGDLHPALEAHYAKFKKTIPALALITHLADGGTGPISEMAIARALDTDAYLRTHAERIYFSGINTEVQSARTILKHIRRDDLPDPFTRRDCHQKHWTGLTEKDQVTEALDVLVEYQWLTVETIATGGRPSTKYSINPKARR